MAQEIEFIVFGFLMGVSVMMMMKPKPDKKPTRKAYFTHWPPNED